MCGFDGEEPKICCPLNKRVVEIINESSGRNSKPSIRVKKLNRGAKRIPTTTAPTTTNSIMFLRIPPSLPKSMTIN